MSKLLTGAGRRRSYIFLRNHFIRFAVLCSFVLFDDVATAVAGGSPPIKIRGTVVDETGAPVPNVRIAAVNGFGFMPDSLTQSDVAGRFTCDLPGRYAVSLVARDAKGERMGFLAPSFVRLSRGEPQRVVLRKSREIPVSVVDGKRRPVAGAKVFTGFLQEGNRLGPREMLEKSTGTDGKILLRVPSDMPLAEVLAVKPGTGFDYRIYDRPEATRIRGNRPGTPSIPATRPLNENRPINLVLGGVHTLRVHLVDQRRRALPGVRVEVTALDRPDRGGPAALISVKEFAAVSDRAGIAEFHAVPAEATGRLPLRATTMGYLLDDALMLNPSETESDVTRVVERLPVLRVQVTWPDGRTAIGARIDGTLREYPGRYVRGMTYIDRSYDAAGEIDAATFMSDAYCVVMARSAGFTSRMEARVARLEEPIRPVHLVLQPAAHVRGRLTWGKDHRPDVNDDVTLLERDDDLYAKLPEGERLPRTLPLADRAHVSLGILHHATTDAQGRFDFAVPPGRYVIGAGFISLNEELQENAKDFADQFDEATREFEIKDQQEIEINLERVDFSSAASRATAPLRGLNRVRLQVTYPDGRPAPEADTQFALRRLDGGPLTLGYRTRKRSHVPLAADTYCVVSATSDGFASSMVARVARMASPVEPVHLILKPAARVHGRFTEGQGRLALANERYFVIQRDENNDGKLLADERLPQVSRIPATIWISHETDAEGRFAFSAAPGRYVLVPGEGHNVRRGRDLDDLETLLKTGAKEFQVKDEKEIEINVNF
jgi:hypothetical protein